MLAAGLEDRLVFGSELVAAVAASSQAEAETGTRHHRLMFWLYRRTTGTSA